jgi:predicted ATPase
VSIELAAAWVHLLSCGEIAQEIERTIDFLAANRRDVLPRHRSLRAAYDHSWRLLTAEEQRVMRQLAVFQGGFTRAAAEQVANAALPVPAALAAKSLLHRTETGRYDLHELVRQYAYDWLCAAQEEGALRSRRLAYFQQWAEQAYRPLLSAEQSLWLNRLAAELGNLRAALAWALHDAQNASSIISGLRLAGVLWLFWWLGDNWREGPTWLRQLLAIALESEQPADQLAYQRARARALYGAATLALDRYDVQEALLLAEESLRLCRASGDLWGVAFSLHTLGALGVLGLGTAEQTNERLQESVTLFRQLDDQRGASLPLEMLGHLAWRRGDHKGAVELLEEALRLNRASGDPTGIVQASDHLARVWIRQGDYARAQTLLEESLAVYHQLGNHFGRAYVLLYLGRIAHAQYDYPQAKRWYEASQAIFQELGSKEGGVFIQRGRLALDEGNVAEARLWLERSVALAQEAGSAELVVEAQIALAMAWLAQGEYAASRAVLAESLSRAQAMHDNDAITQALCSAARLVLAQGEAQRPVRLLAAAQGLWDALGLPLAPEIRVGYEQSLRVVRSQLDETSFHTTWAEGRAMTLEQAITYALAVG